MASTSGFTFDGLAAFKKALRELPDTLKAEAHAIQVSEGSQAEREIEAAYPTKTGELKSGMRLEINNNKFGSVVKVKNTVWWADIYEYGTEGTRVTSTGKDTGRMPPGKNFIPKMIKHRRRATDRIIAMMRREGLEVSGVE